MPSGEHDRQSGFTLVELIVVMAILPGLMLLVYSVLVGVLKDTRSVTERAEAVSQSRLAVAQMERQIRSGNVLFAPSDNSMQIFTQANGMQRCVQWRVETDGQLRTRAWQSDGSGVTAWRTVARNVFNTQARVTAGTAPRPFTLQGGTTAFNSRLISIRLLTQVSSKGGKPVEVNTSVSGRNTQYGNAVSTCTPVPAG